MNFDILWRAALSMIAGWFLGFLATRSALKQKYLNGLKPEGILHLAYDVDDPQHPKMGLEIDRLNYILSHDYILLNIHKIGFPDGNSKVYLQSKDDKSA